MQNYFKESKLKLVGCHLQKDLILFSAWAINHQMPFDTDEYKVEK